MSKNISNEKLDKEIKEWLESFSKEEWIEKLDEEKHLYELRKWLELKEDNTGIFRFKYERFTIEDQGKFVWSKYKCLKKDEFSSSDLNVFKWIPEAA